MNGGLCNFDPLLERRVLTGWGGGLPGPLCFPEAAITDVLTVGNWALSCNTCQSLGKRKEPMGLALKTQGYPPQRAERWLGEAGSTKSCSGGTGELRNCGLPSGILSNCSLCGRATLKS